MLDGGAIGPAIHYLCWFLNVKFILAGCKVEDTIIGVKPYDKANKFYFLKQNWGRFGKLVNNSLPNLHNTLSHPIWKPHSTNHFSVDIVQLTQNLPNSHYKGTLHQIAPQVKYWISPLPRKSIEETLPINSCLGSEPSFLHTSFLSSQKFWTDSLDHFGQRDVLISWPDDWYQMRQFGVFFQFQFHSFQCPS